MESINYKSPEPIYASRNAIEKYVEKFIDNFEVKHPLDYDILISRLGGEINIDNSNSYEDGSIIVNSPGVFSINLSQFTGLLRDRFTIAHEIGHYVLHSKYGEIPLKAARYGQGQVETEANYFAAALLMPKNLFKEKFNDFNENSTNEYSIVQNLASYFLVSESSVSIRMKVLGVNN